MHITVFGMSEGGLYDSVVYYYCDWQINSEPPHLAAYTSYIDHEIKEHDPVRVLCIFERAIVDNCLQPDLWLRYINYVVYIVFVFLDTG